MRNTLHISKKPYLQHHMNGTSLTCHFANSSEQGPQALQKSTKRKQVSTEEKLGQTQWDESDSEPLAKVFQPMNDDGDLSYQPSSGTSSLDDNSPDHNERKTRRLRHSKTIRNAKSASVHQALLLEKERLTHATRLDNLLLANGLRWVDVPADGNCFFEACATTLQHLHADDIRRCLCCCLEENFALFAEFLSVSDQDDPNERYLQYFQNVEELRQPGKWSNDAADMLPLALASWTNQTVRIYSSSPVHPVVDIHPVTRPGR